MATDSSADTTRSPGRPAEFDEGQVIALAMTLFWRRGYDGTSLADLERELGINRSTLYASFDGKAGLYDSAVSRYVEEMEKLLVDPLIGGKEGIDDLLVFLEELRMLLTDRTKPDGCLVVNAMGSGNPPDSMDRYLSNLRTGFDASLSRAAERGEFADDGTDHKASSLLSSAVGLNVIAKSGSSTAELDRLCDGVRAVITGWRRPMAFRHRQ